jgi:hypothetical protein
VSDLEKYMKKPFENMAGDQLGQNLKERQIKCSGVYSSIKSLKNPEKTYHIMFDNFQIDFNGQIFGAGSDQFGQFAITGHCNSENIYTEGQDTETAPIWFIKIYKGSASEKKPAVFNGSYTAHNKIAGDWWQTTSITIAQEISLD